MKRKKIFYLIYSFHRAGAENLVYNLALPLNKKYDIFIASLYENQNKREEFSIIKELNSYGVKTVKIGKRLGKDRYASIIKLAKLFSKEKIDIVHTHTMLPNFYGRIAAALARVPVRIVTFHSGANDWDNKRNYWMERLVMPFTTQYVAVSNYAKSFFVKTFNNKDGAIEVIPNGVDSSKFRGIGINKEAKRQQLGLDAKDIVLINVSNITKAKGQEYLVMAVKELMKDYPNVCLLIAGKKEIDCELYACLKKMIAEFSLGSRIKFLGSREDISDLLAASDIFVFSSVYEASPIALLEAMAVGLPIISTDIPAIREMIVSGKEGVLVPPADSKSIAGAVKDLICNSQKRLILGKNAQKKTVKQFSIEAVAEKYEFIYEKLIQKNGS